MSLVDEKRAAACQPPKVPSEARQGDLESVRARDAMTLLVGKGPPWMRQVALGRSL